MPTLSAPDWGGFVTSRAAKHNQGPLSDVLLRQRQLHNSFVVHGQPGIDIELGTESRLGNCAHVLSRVFHEALRIGQGGVVNDLVIPVVLSISLNGHHAINNVGPQSTP